MHETPRSADSSRGAAKLSYGIRFADSRIARIAGLTPILRMTPILRKCLCIAALVQLLLQIHCRLSRSDYQQRKFSTKPYFFASKRPRLLLDEAF